MRITRDDDPAKVEGQTEEPLEKMSVEELQRTLTALTSRRTLERDRATLIRMITKIRQKQQDQLEAKAEAGKSAATTTERLAALTEMNLPQLREQWEATFGKPSLSRNRRLLIKRLASKIQEDAATPTALAVIAAPVLTVPFVRKSPKSGGRVKGQTTAKPPTKAKETAKKRHTLRTAGERDPRLPRAGCDLVREWRGKKYVVRVLEQGFEYQGKPFRSLSAVANHITGQVVNGFLWFALIKSEKGDS